MLVLEFLHQDHVLKDFGQEFFKEFRIDEIFELLRDDEISVLGLF